MLHKESAIAVMVAIMLGIGSIFGGFSIVPAYATHDPDAVQIANETVSQDDDESIIIDALELTAKKSTSRATGTITIEVIQDDEVLRSTTLKTSILSTFLDDVEAQVANINVTGTFEILVEYKGTGVITVTDIEVIEGTETAEEPPNNNDDGTGEEPDNPSETPEQELENIIASKTIAQSSDETMTVDTIEFSAKKSTSRASGAITVAIVQDDVVLETEQMTTKVLSTVLQDMEISFDDLEVTDDFQVVFMYDGTGVITLRNIDVLGATEPAEEEETEEEEPPTTPPNPEDTYELVVEAVDQNGNKLTGLWVALLNGNNQLVKKGFTEHNSTFTLDADKSYIVEMGDFYNEDTQTAYEFEGWQDSSNDNTRRSVDMSKFGEDKKETFTAEYTVTENASAPPTNGNGEPTTSPPPNSAPGTVTAYAYRIPSEHWGPTFEGANAEMYFVVYNSTGWIVYSGFFDERGHSINGLNEGETYWISPTDCDECHGDPHDVVFDHWEDGSTERQRPVTNGMSVGAYYAYDPDP